MNTNFKRSILLVVCSSIFPLVGWAADPAAVAPTPDMHKMQEQMQLMQKQMQQIQDAKTPEERQRLMQEHMHTMREHMYTMRGGAGMGMGMNKGGMGGGMMGDCVDDGPSKAADGKESGGAPATKK
jgi:hypothetical protein